MPRRGQRVMKGGHRGPPQASASSAATNASQNMTTADNAAAPSASSVARDGEPIPGQAQQKHGGKEQGNGKRGGRDKSKKPPLTHFLCIPLVTAQSRPQLEASMAKFRRGVFGEGEGEADDGQPPADQETDQMKGHAENAMPTTFPPAAVRPVGTLHLTLGVMSLNDSAAVERAISLLHELQPLSSLLSRAETTCEAQSQSHPPSGHSPSSPLSLSLRSLHPMHKPHATSVLYASAHDATNRLLPFASSLRAIFTAADLLVGDDRPLLLHATVVNTVYATGRLRRGGGGGGGGSKSQTKGTVKVKRKFDAREFIERYEDFVWAEGVRVERVAICEMGAVDLGQGRGVAYREVGCVKF